MPATAPEDLAASILQDHPTPALMAAADGALRWLNNAARRLLAPSGAALPERLTEIGIPLSCTVGELAHECTASLRIAGAQAQPYRVAAGPCANGARLFTLTPVSDTSAEVRSACELQERLEAAQQFGRMGVWERDLRTLGGRWDRHVFRFWGLKETAGTPDFEAATRAIVEEDRDGLAKAFRESMRTPGTYDYRYRVRHADGNVRRLHSQWVVTHDDAGRPLRALGVMVDDTEAWDLARAHDATARQLATAVEMGHVAIWRRTVNTHRVHLNTVACKMLGLKSGADGVATSELMERLHPEDTATFIASTQQALAQSEPVDFEVRFRRHDGVWRHVHSRLMVERGPNGEPLEFVGVSTDVSGPRDEARHRGELLRRMSMVGRAAGIGQWSIEHCEERAVYSEQLCAIYGLPSGSKAPPFKEWLTRFVHPQDRDRLAQSCLEWMRSRQDYHEAEYRVMRADGREARVIAHSRKEGEIGKPLVYGIVIDVTERRAAEAALRKAAERAALIAQGVGLGTWEYDLLTGESIWDEQMWRLRGMAPRATPLQFDDMLDLVHPGDRETARAGLERLARSGPTSNEFRVRRPDGQWRWIASRSIALCNDDGVPVRRIGVNWDVTDARNSAAEREERLAAQREVQAKAQFLSRMSHELRTPLNAMLGFTQLLLGHNGMDDPRESARRLEHIRSAGQHLLALIDDVLDLSRLEGGEVAFDVQPTPLPSLVAGLLPLVEPIAQTHGITITLGDLAAVPMADGMRLRQVLLNLLTNGVKYNRPGGTVSVDAASADGVVAIYVCDSGRGMTPEQMRSLFEPFNRLGAETTTIEGTGIGLAIVKALVERMGGTVHVDSTQGKGSRFELRLRDGGEAPAMHAAQVSPQALALAATNGRVGRGGTVLYVEDNPVNSMIVAELIAQRKDLKFHTASLGEEGLMLARKLRPQLILLDMQLPDINGLEVFARLQADPATARIPCIALSANAMPADIERAMLAGFADYWTKPLDFSIFKGSVDALFGPEPIAAATA